MASGRVEKIGAVAAVGLLALLAVVFWDRGDAPAPSGGTLWVRVDDRRYCSGNICKAVPAPGASVVVTRDIDGAPGEVVNRTSTRHLSAVAITLPYGPYLLDVSLDGRNRTVPISLFGDVSVDYMFDGPNVTAEVYRVA